MLLYTAVYSDLSTNDVICVYFFYDFHDNESYYMELIFCFTELQTLYCLFIYLLKSFFFLLSV